jgi:hypothetical protein
MPTREALLEMLWAQNQEAVYITKDQFMQSLDGCDIKQHEVNGELVGATLTRGQEFHFAVFAKGWHLTRADIRHYLQPILDAHGCVKTKTPHEDVRQQRFNKLIGFEPDGHDEYYQHFKLKRLLHV